MLANDDQIADKMIEMARREYPKMTWFVDKLDYTEDIAESVQFLGGRDENAPSQGGASQGGGFTPTRSDVPVDTSDYASAPAGGGATADDDIPF